MKTKKFVCLFFILNIWFILPSAYAEAENEAVDPTPAQTIEKPPLGEGLAAQLAELKSRLLAPPACTPHCVAASLLVIRNTNDALALNFTVDALAASSAPLPVPANQQNNDWQPDTITLDGAPAPLYRDENGQLWVALTTGRHLVAISGSTQNLDQVTLPLPLMPRVVEVQATAWEMGAFDPKNQTVLALTRRTTETVGANPENPQNTTTISNNLLPLVRVERTLHFGLTWTVDTRVERISPSQNALLVDVALLPNETITSGQIAEKGQIRLSFAPGINEARWTGQLPIQPDLVLRAPNVPSQSEVWRAEVSPFWHLQWQGVPLSISQDLPTWRPWPNEKLTLHLSKPKGISEAQMTIQNSRLTGKLGARSSEWTMQFTLDSSQGGQHSISLPKNSQVVNVSYDGAPQPVRQESQRDHESVILNVHPGSQDILLTFRDAVGLNNTGLGVLFDTPRVDLGLKNVNQRLNVQFPENRWTLALFGFGMGPTVLFWSMVFGLGIIAFILGKISELTPYKLPLQRGAWLLLLLGLSQTSLILAAVLIGTWLALAWRGRTEPQNWGAGKFQFIQIWLGFFMVVSLFILISSITNGLLGAPDMMIAGNDSTNLLFNWYQDLSPARLEQATIVSVPLWVYRILMLAWALWLATRLLRWLPWQWQQFTQGGLWPVKAIPVKNTEQNQI